MKKVYIILLIVCVLCVGVCAGLFIYYDNMVSSDETPYDDDYESLKVYDTTVPADTVPEGTTGADTSDTALETQPVPSEPLMDFGPVKQVNPDVCAWLEIPGLLVDYPVLQSPTDDSKYLDTALDGSYYIGGSLFTEHVYNSTDFNDPVTIIYGHTMKSGAIFGQLESTYTDPATFEAHRDIRLYLEGEVRHYRIFASLPFDKRHIMYTYDFNDPYVHKLFFKEVRESRELVAIYDESIVPTVDDRVLILSTCLAGDSNKRYLVLAINQDDLADNGGLS